ncbi:hypothetical protein HMPREF3036_00741 [Sutterella sp. KLE1602]|nr:hypothetical protein HMPREF3036_00741 [Sutterella sp. KLE1602]
MSMMFTSFEKCRREGLPTACFPFYDESRLAQSPCKKRLQSAGRISPKG